MSLAPSETLAYLAGLLDGEGCIGAYNSRSSKGSKRPFAQITIRVAMRTPLGPQLLHSVFGGSLRVTRGRYFDWCVRGRQAIDCLVAVFPYLREKRTQAETAMALDVIRKAPGRALTEAQVAEREMLVQHLRDLKREVYVN